ncbi:hypothetical protein PCANC_09487 [Puccinia coronata f. sp. avenae]|uniref:Uncharacterized protein n=1 Tax=Puccinia coronata f. sp. avenae TaxID=200324 RepID=A0A2N5VVL1_9BASI|nr:hypothetical protein PCANC_11255 [Puccinia coronata f. sp. avenae]PLW54019.1 hypothetical protein PCANC_09487 [Puccinia coronata f. sp. avenae]
MAASRSILDAAIQGKLGFGPTKPRKIISLVDTQAVLGTADNSSSVYLPFFIFCPLLLKVALAVVWYNQQGMKLSIHVNPGILDHSRLARVFSKFTTNALKKESTPAAVVSQSFLIKIQ